MQHIAFDSHKKYTWASVADPKGNILSEGRIPHSRGTLRHFLARYDAGSPVAVETIGHWYWIVDEIESAGMVPKLVHARKAKLMMGMVNKTDKLDARGMNRLQQAGTLPIVWIPPGELRDQRELPRTRMSFTQRRTQLKNRIHSNLAKYAVQIEETSDLFGTTGRRLLEERLRELPPYCLQTTRMLLQELDLVQSHIEAVDREVKETFQETEALQLLRSLPGVDYVLGVVILLEVGDVTRFATPAHLASYAGTTPRVHSSGGKTRWGPLRNDVNRFLKWAFMEAANSICVNRARRPERHVSRLYQRIAQKKGHATAIGAVARHLAEAAHVVLSKKQPYADPGRDPVSSREPDARPCHGQP